MSVLRELATALALTVALAAIWFLAFQGRIYGNDGAMLADWAAGTTPIAEGYHNPLFVRTEALLSSLWAGDRDVWDPLRAMSAFTMAIGVGAAFLIARRLGAGYLPSLLGALFLAGTPMVTFFATCFEVHGLHFGLCALAALVTVCAPWRWTWLAAAISAVALGCTYLSHQAAPALGPGFVVLATWRRAQVASEREDVRPFTPIEFVLVGAVMLVGLVLGHATNGWLRGDGFGIDLGFVEDKVTFWRRPFGAWMVWQGFVQPLAFALPLGLWVTWNSLRSAGERRGLGASFLVFFVPLCAFVLWWGIPERGGYLLGPAFLLAVVLAKSGLSLRMLAGLALFQIVVGVVETWRFDDEGFQLDERTRLVQEQIDGGRFVVSFNDNAPNIAARLDSVQELQLIRTAPEELLDTDRFVQTTIGGLRVGTSFGPVLLDRSYRFRIRDGRGPFSEQVDALESAIREQFEVEELPDDSWPMWRLRSR